MLTAFTPVYSISRGGIDITSRFSDRCVSIRVDYQGEDGSEEDTCTIIMDDRDFAIARPTEGETISISMGYAEIGMHNMGSFVIDEVHFLYPPKSIMLKGKSSGSDTDLKSHITQEFKGKTLGDLFKTFAQKGGFGAQVHPQIASKAIDFLNAKGSAYQNIQELARANGAIAKVVKGTLQVVPRDQGQDSSGDGKPIIILRPEHFGTYDVKHANQGSYQQVRAAYRDPKTFIPKFIDHDNPIKSIEGTAKFVINRLFATEDEAKGAAEAQMGALNKSLGEAHLTLAKGDPWITDQQRIMIVGLRDGVNGSYVTSIVSHTYVKDQGIQTEILAKSPGGGDKYESFYEKMGDEEQNQMFLDPGPGGLVGSVIDRALTGRPPNIQDLINGMNPF